MMKPFIWINKTVHAEFDGAKGDLGMTVSAWNDNLNQYAKFNDLKPMDVPLYTSDQLAEAVAAEREKNAKACEAQRVNEISAPADWHNDACKDCARAIRSAAK